MSKAYDNQVSVRKPTTGRMDKALLDGVLNSPTPSLSLSLHLHLRHLACVRAASCMMFCVNATLLYILKNSISGSCMWILPLALV